jgi:SAM-dependent methyltransferase
LEKTVIDLGEMPLANSLLSSQMSSVPRYTLRVMFCTACSLLQLYKEIPPESLFDEYLYFSSYSDSFVTAAGRLVDRLAGRFGLDESSQVLEIASNDGYLLQHYVAKGIPCLGIEPAGNVAMVAEERGVPTLVEYFTKALAERLSSEGKSADIVHANNVLAHVPDLNDMVSGLAAVLAPGGSAVLEVPYVRDLVDKGAFDTIYHEHVYYFSCSALVALFKNHEMIVYGVERIPVHGGSLRIYVGREGEVVRDVSVDALLKEEERCGISTFSYFSDFALRAREASLALFAALTDLKAAGNRIVAYGAAAKATVFLNYAGIDNQILDYVVDRSTHKQGKWLPGVGLEIRDPDALVSDKPDYVVIMAWNFADEIISQQTEYSAGGGRFIIPIPEVRIV